MQLLEDDPREDWHIQADGVLGTALERIWASAPSPCGVVVV